MEKNAEALKEKLYHHLDIPLLQELRVKISEKGIKHRDDFSILGISSKETIRSGMKAVDKSPFQTVFVLDVKSGKVLFVLSKNEEFVKAERKKNPPPPPPPDPPSTCCQLCRFQGGTDCDEFGDGSCICYGADRIDADLDDPLEILAP